MSFPKILGILTILLFGAIITASLFKKSQHEDRPTEFVLEPVEVDITEEIVEAEGVSSQEAELQIELEEEILPDEEPVEEEPAPVDVKDLPDADRVNELFSVRGSKLPIVQTVTYKSKVPWLKGRPAWIADYSSHYKTSRHFIARSLNGVPNYDKQDVKNGDRFNVFADDKDFEFYLVIDILTSRMWFYYIDKDNDERELLKTYAVGLGRPDPSSASGYLTPTGKYTLGDKIAVYRPKTRGFYQGDKIEMVRVFGTRWIPFAEEVADCTEPARGFGIHGLPLSPDGRGELVEDIASLGKYESDGCVRMATKDVEELFSIVISRPTTVEIVKGFQNATPPGVER